MTFEGVTAVSIVGLFGDRDIHLKLDAREPAIITGANGSGKSTILKLIYAISSGDLETLARAPVRELAVEFANMDTFSMRRTGSSADASLELQWGSNRDPVHTARNIEDLPDWALDALRENDWDVGTTMASLLDYVGPLTPRPRVSEFRRARDVLSKFVHSQVRLEAPEWFGQLQDAFPAIFITDQRLVVEPSRRQSPESIGGSGARTSMRAVEAASHGIADSIAKADSDYARRSQAIDREFPSDVVAAMMQDKVISQGRTFELLNRVERERESLREVGLLDRSAYQDSLGVEGLDEERVRPVVFAFLQSTERKLAVLRELGRKLSAFKDFLDKRFAPKSIQFSRSLGMRVQLPDGSLLRPVELSSGEQQMVVMAWEILFRTQPHTLVIIDEPEISLHVLWQDSLVDDLLAMSRASELQFLMATHSPAVIGGHSDLERSLDDYL